MAPRPVSVPSHTWVIAYDIADDRRRAHVARVLEGHGLRVQWSVFECRCNRTEMQALRRRLLELAEPGADRLRFYPLCGPCALRISEQGLGAIETDGEGGYRVI
ncbi:MAG: CRISPR-associated endonuclease Cas2 [Pseudomonadota bacterium]|nr:CRISPR-associated endonuclease Cas2 [Pseudomonadota bacterium]